jgi:FkbM family methyltransferase
MALAAVRQWVREHRRSPTLRALAEGCEKYLRAYHNEGHWVFAENGEGFVLDRFAAWFPQPDPVVWDVGSHAGGWAATARRTLPAAQIHSFELIPAIAERLRLRMAGDARHVTHAIGLSDSERTVEAVHRQGLDTTNSLAPVAWEDESIVMAARVTTQVTTIDRLVERLPAPDFLKIDVEGHEVGVLRGAAALIAGDRAPALIQFEYGQSYIAFDSLLAHAYALLEPAGYAIGRIFPNHVAFVRWRPGIEQFRAGNMVAVRDDGLKRLLQG